MKGIAKANKKGNSQGKLVKGIARQIKKGIAKANKKGNSQGK